MFKRFISLFVIITFILSCYQPGYGQDFSINQLPVPGTMIGESVPFAPLALKGLVINPNKPLEFQFIVDTGKGPQDNASIKEESSRLVKYFLAGLTIPEGELWVNLSPYEKNRITTPSLGQTTLGRDLLAQDYILKQLTASLIYPEKDLGKKFWSRVYAKAQQRFGTTNVPINTFNKVWILPDQAQVFENGPAAYVTKATLKVMLDEDYLAKQKHQVSVRNDVGSVGANIVREIVIPEITKEVNTGKNFAPLRQIYDAMILCKWYKETFVNGILDAVYTNKNKTDGVNASPVVKEQIYQRYLQAYKKGVFNYIKDTSTPNGVPYPRKYFSGGTFLKIDHLEVDGAMKAVSEDHDLVDVDVHIQSLSLANGHQKYQALKEDLHVQDIILRFYRANRLSERKSILEELKNIDHPKAREIVDLYYRLESEIPPLKEYDKEDVILDWLPKAFSIIHSGGDFRVRYVPGRQTPVKYIKKEILRWQPYKGGLYIDYKNGKISALSKTDDLEERIIVDEFDKNSMEEDTAEVIQIERVDRNHSAKVDTTTQERIATIEGRLKEIRGAIAQSRDVQGMKEELMAIRAELRSILMDHKEYRPRCAHLYYLSRIMADKMIKARTDLTPQTALPGATQILLIDQAGKRVLLQKRGDYKRVFAGKLTVSANTKKKDSSKLTGAVKEAIFNEVGINVNDDQVKMVYDQGSLPSYLAYYEFYALGEEENVLKKVVGEVKQVMQGNKDIAIEYDPIKRAAVVYTLNDQTSQELLKQIVNQIRERTGIDSIGPVINRGTNFLAVVRLSRKQEAEVGRISEQKRMIKEFAMKKFNEKPVLDDLEPMMEELDSDDMGFLPWTEVFNAAKNEPDKFARDLTGSYFGNAFFWEKIGMSVPLIVDLDDPLAATLELVGGKGMNLAILKKLSRYIKGLLVPETRIITTEAYNKFVLGDVHIMGLIKQLDKKDITDAEIDRLSDEIKEAILKLELPEEFRRSVYAQWEELGGDIAVRSSATMEDLKQYAAAGKADSFLSVTKPEDALDKVKEVWASLFNRAFIKDRKKYSPHVSQTDVKMAVVMQAFVNSKAAGAAKTVGPFERPVIRINANGGIGESVVEGEGEVDTWDVNITADKILEKNIKVKTSRYVKKDGGGIEKKKGALAEPAMDDETVLRLAKVIYGIKAFYRANDLANDIDVEFAVDPTGRIFIVQTRAEDRSGPGSAAQGFVNTVDIVDEELVPPEVKRVHLNELGLTASFGVAEGKLMIIRHAYGMHQLQSNVILVTQHTNNEWNDVFSKLAGVITSDGGDTSHAAKNSRRHGIPSCVGSSGALQQLAAFDGQIVTFDSTNKFVYLAGNLPKKKISISSNLWTENEDVFKTRLGQRERHELFKPWAHNQTDRNHVFLPFFDGNFRRRSSTYPYFELDYYYKAWDRLTDYLNKYFKGRTPWELKPQERLIRDSNLFHRIIDDHPESIYYFLSGIKDVSTDDFVKLFEERFKAFRHFKSVMGGVEVIKPDNVEMLMNELVEAFVWMHMAYWINSVVNINELPEAMAGINPLYTENVRWASLKGLSEDKKLDISRNKDVEMLSVLEQIRMVPELQQYFIEHGPDNVIVYCRTQPRFNGIIERIEAWSRAYKKDSENVLEVSDTRKYLVDIKQRLINPTQVKDELIVLIYENFLRKHPKIICDLKNIHKKDHDFYFMLRGIARSHIVQRTMASGQGPYSESALSAGVAALTIDLELPEVLRNIQEQNKEKQALQTQLATVLGHYPQLKRILSLSMRETLLREDGHHIIVPLQRKIARMMLNVADQFKDVLAKPEDVFNISVDEFIALFKESPSNRSYIALTPKRILLEDIADKQLREDWVGPDHLQAVERFNRFIDTATDILNDQINASTVQRTKEYYKSEIVRLYERKVKYWNMLSPKAVNPAQLTKLSPQGIAQNGGIDLDQINVRRRGKTIKIKFDAAQLNKLTQGEFEGFTPVITSVVHITSPFPLLGINPVEEPEEVLAKA